MFTISEFETLKVGSSVQWSDGAQRAEGIVTKKNALGIEVKWSDGVIGTFSKFDALHTPIWPNE